MSMPNPIVLLDARARYVHPAITCGRASAKWLFGPDGQRHRVPENAMPWEYDPVTGELLGLRVESQATNLISYTDVDNWSKGNVTVSDAGDGWRRVEAQNSGSEGRSVTIALDAVTDGNYYTYSVDLMAGETPYGFLALSGAAFRDGSTSGLRIGFNIIEKEYAIHAEEEVTVDFVSFRDIGDGAVRMTFSALALNAEAPNCQIFLKDGLNPASGDSTLSAGDGFYVRAPQVEAFFDPTVPTPGSSWIETTGASAQRSADTLRFQNIIDWSWFGGLSGTFVVEHTYRGDAYNVEQPLLKLGQSAASFDGLLLRRSSSGRMGVRARLGDVFYESATRAQLDGLNRSALSFDFAKENVTYVMNGGVVSTPTVPAFSLNDIASLYIGSGAISGGSERSERRFEGWIRRVVYYPQRLSNADLQSLTAIQE